MSAVPFDDSLSETSSVADEERVRKLFQACDYNGDGYIDSSDLEMVCRELELGPCVQELLCELGADRTGRVSYKDFLSRRRALRCEIDALKESDAAHSGDCSSQDIPATSNSANSFNKQELWEWDSGARDLSPEPSGKPSPPAAPDAMAELASTLHLAAVSSLKNEVLELSARLHAAHRDRDGARDALCAAQSECGRLRSALSLQARSSEERMTELHGVIAELRRACSARERAAIPELREDDSEVETSCRENSITGGSDRTTSVGDADETASVHNDQDANHSPRRTPTSPAALPVPEFPSHRQPHLGDEAPSSPLPLSRQASGHATTDTDAAGNQHDGRNLAPADSTSFDEEEIIEIDRRLRCRRRPSPRSPRRAMADQPRDAQQDMDDEEELQQRFPSLAVSRQHSPCIRSGVVSSSSPQTKMASRVRLRRTHEDARLTGKDICQEGVYSSAVAEHLTRGSLSRCEDEGEERLSARVDRLEADNMLLAVTLRESKEHADRLSLACAQCSAEAGALRMALAAADRAVEAYDVLLALAETSQHPQDSQGSIAKMRLATERVARQLLARLDSEADGRFRADVVGPWADPAAMLLYQGANDGKAWSTEEEERLRGHVSRLKRERTVAASGAQPAQWPLQDDPDGIEDNLSGIARGSDKPKCMDAADARKLDMETAVLMQEVMSLREERAELRARLRALRPPGSRQTNSSSGADEGESERRLLEALARENTLKARLQRLMASVNQAGRTVDTSDDLRRGVCPRCGPQTNRMVTSDDAEPASSISMKEPSPAYQAEEISYEAPAAAAREE